MSFNVSAVNDDVFADAHWNDLDEDVHESNMLINDAAGIPTNVAEEVDANEVAQAAAAELVIDIERPPTCSESPSDISACIRKYLVDVEEAKEQGIRPTLRIKKRIAQPSHAADGNDEGGPPSQAGDDGEEAPVRKKKRRASKVLLEVMGMVAELLDQGLTVTKRNTELFGSQSAVDQAIEDLACCLRVSRHKLNVVAAAKGLLYGPARITLQDGTILDGMASQRGTIVPPEKDIVRIETEAYCALVVEKEATFAALVDSGFPTQVEERWTTTPSTGSLPQRAAQALAKAHPHAGETLLNNREASPDIVSFSDDDAAVPLLRPSHPDTDSLLGSDLDDEILEVPDGELGLAGPANGNARVPQPGGGNGRNLAGGRFPMLCLVDCDAHGINILCCYKYGSKAMAYDRENLACPSLAWIGLLPHEALSELVALDGSTVPLTKRDQALVRNLLTSDPIRTQRSFR
ncbi:endodeoxyribonuclease [Phlyctochytrium bullatum]|nr:endodeoxyribonuclease [Phlyctochytrium bullatum]